MVAIQCILSPGTFLLFILWVELTIEATLKNDVTEATEIVYESTVSSYNVELAKNGSSQLDSSLFSTTTNSKSNAPALNADSKSSSIALTVLPNTTHGSLSTVSKEPNDSDQVISTTVLSETSSTLKVSNTSTFPISLEQEQVTEKPFVADSSSTKQITSMAATKSNDITVHVTHRQVTGDSHVATEVISIGTKPKENASASTMSKQSTSSSIAATNSVETAEINVLGSKSSSSMMSSTFSMSKASTTAGVTQKSSTVMPITKHVEPLTVTSKKQPKTATSTSNKVSTPVLDTTPLSKNRYVSSQLLTYECE